MCSATHWAQGQLRSLVSHCVAALPPWGVVQVEIMHMRHKLDTDTRLIRWVPPRQPTGLAVPVLGPFSAGSFT